MAKLLRITTALACILLGAVVGMLNPQPVRLDLGFALLQTSLGLAVLVALLLGVIVGGTVLALAVVAPLRHRLRATQGRQPTRPREG